MRSLASLGVIFLCVASGASAQVTLDLHALQALPERGGPTVSVPRAPATHYPSAQAQTTAPPTAMSRVDTAASGTSTTAAGRSATSSPQSSTPATSAATVTPSTAANSTPPATPPALPQDAPQTAMITPIAPSPPASTPPPPPVSDKAATSAAPAGAGLRITFASGQSDLSPASVDLIKQLANATPAADSTSFNVMAYAPASADDPSAARRMSLSRAMAVRSALVADGVSSARIYVRAMGAQHGEGPPDRVDLNVLGGNDPPSAAVQAAPR